MTNRNLRPNGGWVQKVEDLFDLRPPNASNFDPIVRENFICMKNIFLGK